MSEQVKVLAECIAQVWGNEEVGPMEMSEALDIVDALNKSGWRITRQDPADEFVSDGPIQRALGIDGGNGASRS